MASSRPANKRSHTLGTFFIREIYASQKFYERRLAREFAELAVYTNAKKIGKQGREAAAASDVKIYDRLWVLRHLRQYGITKLDLLRRLDKPRLEW
jgi:hypothetical protein